MGYLKIRNLYQVPWILDVFRKVYTLEKIHGTSAHIKWNGSLNFFSGGEKHSKFIQIFDYENLTSVFQKMQENHDFQKIIVYGEAYGGKQQGMSDTYGPELRFIVFDVKIDKNWTDLPTAVSIANQLGLEFVDFNIVSADKESLDKERDKPSKIAKKLGVGDNKKREGIVIRPLFELTRNDGSRIIAKYKNNNFRETKTPRKVGQDPVVLTEAKKIAEEWVTWMRLQHVLDKLPDVSGIEHTKHVIHAMIEDITIEAEGEVVLTKQAKKEIGKSTAKLWKRYLKQKI